MITASQYLPLRRREGAKLARGCANFKHSVKENKVVRCAALYGCGYVHYVTIQIFL